MISFDSPFLAVPADDWLCSNDLAFAIFDGFPVSPGPGLPKHRPPKRRLAAAPATGSRHSLSPQLSDPGSHRVRHGSRRSHAVLIYQTYTTFDLGTHHPDF